MAPAPFFRRPNESHQSFKLFSMLRAPKSFLLSAGRINKTACLPMNTNTFSTNASDTCIVPVNKSYTIILARRLIVGHCYTSYFEVGEFLPNAFIGFFDDKLTFQCIKLFVVFRCSRVKCYGRKKNPLIKMKINPYYFGNARFLYTKFIKSKSYLPMPDSVFLLVLESGHILYPW